MACYKARGLLQIAREGQQLEAMQSAIIAARTANSAKPSAKNIKSVLMAIPRQQFVALQSKYLFHLVSLSSNPNLARTGKGYP
jgi:hypothetical protein